MADDLPRLPAVNVSPGVSVIHYVLVDHENVQPTDIGLLDRVDVRVFVFVGAQQGKLSSDMAIRIHNLGERAKYVRASAVGANALDFHIAFYVGQLAAKDPRGFFHVISKDKGYDPLLAHLKEQGISGARSEAIKTMPLFKSQVTAAKTSATPASAAKAKVKQQPAVRMHFIVEPVAPKTSGLPPVIPVKPPVVSMLSLPLADAKTTAQRWTKLRSGLKKMDGNRPSTMSALKKHVSAQFNGDKVGQDTVDALIAGLIKFGLLTATSNNTLTWHGDKF